jgi:hypothetical protein
MGNSSSSHTIDIPVSTTPIDILPHDTQPIDISNIILDDLQIIIGPYLFTLISYDSDDLNNRGSVKISSKSIISKTDIQETFFVYSSKSELGFWRLCAMEDIYKQLYKGDYDYVQQTFIHLDLQNFININLDKILKTTNHKHCKYPNSKIKTNVTEHANNTNRILQLNFSVEEFNNIYFKEAVYKPGLQYCHDPPDPRTLSYISDYLENNYEIMSNNFKFDFNRDINIEEGADLIVRGKIYECVLEKKTVNTTTRYNNNIYLYYLSYSINIGDINEENQFIPIFATDINYNKITRFGLYYNYIMMYQYICKCLQYTKICRRHLDNSYPICSTHYSYIGNIYQNLFPFIRKSTHKELKNQVEIKNQVEEIKNQVDEIKNKGLLPSSQIGILNKLRKREIKKREMEREIEKEREIEREREREREREMEIEREMKIEIEREFEREMEREIEKEIEREKKKKLRKQVKEIKNKGLLPSSQIGILNKVGKIERLNKGLVPLLYRSPNDFSKKYIKYKNKYIQLKNNI